MIRFIRSLFAWRIIFGRGSYIYEENMVTGNRRVRKDHILRSSQGWRPIDHLWLDGKREGWGGD